MDNSRFPWYCPCPWGQQRCASKARHVALVEHTAGSPVSSKANNNPRGNGISSSIWAGHSEGTTRVVHIP